MKKINNILWGLLLIVLGVLIGLDTFEIVDINFFFDGWWTLFIIVPCTIDLFRSRDKTFDFIGIAVGVFLLLACQELITFEMLLKLLIPTVLVLVGASLIFKDAIGGKAAKQIKILNEQKSNRRNVSAAFSSQKIKCDNEILESMDISASFGGVECDLSNAILNNDVVLNCNVSFGGIDIIIPVGANVAVKSTSIFGGVSDKTENTADPNMPTIYINAVCIFGGVDII